jgi:pyruvate dehydrogenase E2 component (dihydrolipoyllysine-residue acetyltransferase)
MAASRSMLEALLARVQKRAQEPRAAGINVPPLPAAEAGHGAHDAAETLPPRAAAGLAQQPELELADADDDDIEEYDEELIEIIDDADVIPQAAAAARAIEPSAFGANLERRGAPNGKSSVPAAAAAAASAAPVAPVAPVAPAVAPRAVTAPPAAAEPLRPETVAARPVAPSPVVHTRGVRRELRATPFLELLDASLKLGS